MFWPIIGAAEDGDDGGDGGEATRGGHADVSLEELKAELADLGLTPGQLKGRLAASRKWEDRAKGRTRSSRRRRRRRRSTTRCSRPRRPIRNAPSRGEQEAKAAAQLEAAPRIVRAEFRAAAKGVLTTPAR
jgi:hypothetical protein